ncbi:MAG: hypothetical protein EP338_04680 [Bacteroidetes bacterium]|nr:MAG: hypothetical protein EP338_04680 [Bacteroidota bacterium]
MMNLEALEHELKETLGSDFRILQNQALSGGDINEVHRLETSEGGLVIKLNSKDRFPGMFEAEADGLNELRKSQFRIPEMIAFGTSGNNAYLLMEYIDLGKPGTDFWNSFGHKLAAMHRLQAENYGLEKSNYIGSLPQSNGQHESWITFYLEERILPQLRKALDQGDLNKEHLKIYETFAQRVSGIFPVEAPSLLHGDLWSGNYLVDATGEAVLIDPAVYYGHREMDLGMTLLFGGFPTRLYEAYHESYPLEQGWRERVSLTQLYPLLVHLNLFGASYRSSVLRILEQYA